MNSAERALRDELSALRTEADLVAAARGRFDQEAGNAEDSAINKIALAALIESVYSGAERSLSLIAREIDRNPIAKTDSWHREVIKRMSAPARGREAVLSPSSAELMNDLRGFRHKVRSNYGSSLIAATVRERSEQAERMARSVAGDIETFLDKSAGAGGD